MENPTPKFLKPLIFALTMTGCQDFSCSNYYQNMADIEKGVLCDMELEDYLKKRRDEISFTCQLRLEKEGKWSPNDK